MESPAVSGVELQAVDAAWVGGEGGQPAVEGCHAAVVAFGESQEVGVGDLLVSGQPALMRPS